MKHFIKHVAVVAILAGSTQVVQALSQLQVTDGTSTLTITDNGVGDTSNIAGRILWDGSIGNWHINTHIGTAFPVIGSLQYPMLDLSFNAISNSAGGTLTLLFSSDGFGPTTNGGVTGAIGGTAAPGAAVSYSTFGGTNNTLFDTSQLLTSQGPFGGAFSGTAASSFIINNEGPYQMTQKVVITHTGSGITTGDSLVSVPDGGSSIALLGAAVAAMGLFVRGRKRLA
jgi:hypothetical protein